MTRQVQALSRVWYAVSFAFAANRPGGAGPGSTRRFAGVAARPRQERVSGEAGLVDLAPASRINAPCLVLDTQLLTREWAVPPEAVIPQIPLVDAS
jgi:hypothetical protein